MTRGVTFPLWFNRSHSQGESNWSSTVRGGSGSLITGMCQLHMGTYHLPLQGLDHVLQQLLTFNTP